MWEAGHAGSRAPFQPCLRCPADTRVLTFIHDANAHSYNSPPGFPLDFHVSLVFSKSLHPV
jgi:hypothetical protein